MKKSMPKDADIDQEDTRDNIYAEQARESLMEDDEISVIEAAFMEGYEEANSEEEEEFADEEELIEV